MNIYTMGFTQKSAEQFFGKIKENNIEILVDVRLNNKSQLAGFTKGRDLKYFLDRICSCEYDHDVMYAPTKEILQKYNKGEMVWSEYETNYIELINKRKVAEMFKTKYVNYSRILLLCSEATSEFCHRRLLAEYLKRESGCNVIHI